MQTLAKQILKISYELGLSHIGSCLSILPILIEIYGKKNSQDIVILDNAHAHLAHLLFIQRFNVEKFIKWDIHCNRKVGCDASGGSLGHGIGIGIGYALTDRNRDVYVVTSDGAMNEGSNWEALRLRSQLNLTNLKIYVNWNGYTATDKSDSELIEGMIGATTVKNNVYKGGIHMVHTTNGISFLNGINGHYDVLTKETYEKAIKEIDDNEKLAKDLDI